MSDNASMWETLNCLPDAVEHMIHGDPDEPDSVKASDAVRWAIAEIVKLREERRWVPVGERLPEHPCWVIAFDAEQQLVIYVHFSSDDYHDGPVWENDRGRRNPTHWMPLPPAPEGA